MMNVSSGSHSVDVSNPELKDTEARDTRVGIYRAMAGDVYAYRATPVPRILSLTISKLTVTQTEDLIALFDERIEYEITFVWGSTTIAGFVVSPIIFKSVGGLREITLEIRE